MDIVGITGVSAYGTEVNITSTTNSNGFAYFEELESGIYTLTETVAPANHELDETERGAGGFGSTGKK